MSIKITLAEIKQEAKNYKTQNPNIKHTESLNLISQHYGYEKYEILKAKADKSNGVIEFMRDVPITKADEILIFPISLMELRAYLLSLPIPSDNNSYFMKNTIQGYVSIIDVYSSYYKSINSVDALNIFINLMTPENISVLLFKSYELYGKTLASTLLGKFAQKIFKTVDADMDFNDVVESIYYKNSNDLNDSFNDTLIFLKAYADNKTAFKTEFAYFSQSLYGLVMDKVRFLNHSNPTK